MTEEKKYHAGFVTIIGRPNVGKSTLMNHLIGQKIAITSNKPQTTRHRIQTVYTCDEGQIVFLDTPGIHKAKNKLGEYMDKVAESSIRDVDLILWLVEPDAYHGENEQQILEQLRSCKTPVILVINKADKTEKEKIGELMEGFRKEMDFADIVPVSALKGQNLEELTRVILSHLPEGMPFYDEETVTDQQVRQIAGEIIREKVLRCLKDEVPHGVAVSVEKMKEKENIWEIDADIICERDSHKGIIIGKKGSMLRTIGSQSRKDIEEMLEKQVFLQLFVKVRPNWRDDQAFLRSLGYDPKKINQ
ncbi:MAG: GTPase Era [Lachnospiraceae bacterium]|nr:GTPase Era [Lachnospiraceae bacterium]